jgi:hypothetical protein
MWVTGKVANETDLESCTNKMERNVRASGKDDKLTGVSVFS